MRKALKPQYLVASAMIALAGCATVPPPQPYMPPQAQKPADQPAPAAIPAAADNQAAMARMSEMTRVLASDNYYGRAPGGPGEQPTIDYLIGQFRAAGLEPAGDNGTYVQTVPMLHTKLTGPVVASVKHGSSTTPLKWGDDYSLSTVLPVSEAKIVNAPLVFVGYGVKAPERGWDDFKGMDLKGKVLLFLVNDPDFEAKPGEDANGQFGGKSMTFYGRWVYKFEEAARQGAIGAFVIHQADAAGYGWNVAGGGGSGENYAIELPAGTPRPPLLEGWMQGPVAASLLKQSGLDYDTLKQAARRKDFRPVALNSTISVATPVSVERITSRNVLGKLSGRSHPDQIVSYGGHWDAFGIGKPDVQGRTVRAGALDDALGLAAMMEVARRFSAGPRPERSLLFAAWTAEERGLLGSEYYALHPLYPMAKTVANLTFDTLQPVGPVRDVVLIGKGQSEMEALLAQEAAKQGRTITIEGHPERGLFYRADHFTFAKRGVPTLLSMALAGAYDFDDGGRAAGDKWLNDFTANCYHQPCDNWSANWDLRGALEEADLFYAIGEKLANGSDWPKWLPGSEFARIRAETDAQRQ